MDLHFLSSVLFTIVFMLQVINPDLEARMKLIPAVIVLFYATLVFFSLDYEKRRRKAWERKKRKLIEEVYSRFVKMFLERKQEMGEDDFREIIEREKRKWVEGRVRG